MQPKKKRKQKYQPIYTVVPVKANLQIVFREKPIYEKQLLIPQLGILQPIPFRKIDKESQIYIDATTGSILSIVEE